MRSLLFVGGGILIGAGLVWVEAHVSAEKRAREEIEEQVASHKRILDMTRPIPEAEAPVDTEEELTFNAEGSVLEMAPEAPTPEYVQQYVEQATVYGDPATFQSQMTLTELTEDEYAEDDGREKSLIQVFMGDGEPYFVEDGMVIEDHKEKIGDTILVSFYQRFPPGYVGERTIYVRNNQTDTDYEVTQEMGP